MLTIGNWIGADAHSDVMDYIDVDWHAPEKHDDKWLLTFAVNDGDKPRLGHVLVDDLNMDATYGSRQIVPGHATRNHDGTWVLWYLAINNVICPVVKVADTSADDANSDADTVHEVRAYFTNDFRALDDGTVERLFYVMPREYQRSHFWVRYQRDSAPIGLPEAGGEMVIKFRQGHDDEDQQPNSCGFMLTDNGVHEIVRDEPQHLLTRAQR